MWHEGTKTIELTSVRHHFHLGARNATVSWDFRRGDATNPCSTPLAEQRCLSASDIITSLFYAVHRNSIGNSRINSPDYPITVQASCCGKTVGPRTRLVVDPLRESTVHGPSDPRASLLARGFQWAENADTRGGHGTGLRGFSILYRRVIQCVHRDKLHAVVYHSASEAISIGGGSESVNVMSKCRKNLCYV